MMLTLCITNAATKSRSKKHYGSSSEEETIENLLYFKDCQPKEQPTTKAPIPLRFQQPPPPPPPPPQPQCPFPKMCCTLTCGNECSGTKESALISRQMEPIQRQHYQPFQPTIQSRGPAMPDQSARKRKRIKFPAANMQTPINSRRGFGLTKEKIKSLINQDGDIRKILKDLVRVTMQKVDLIELQKGSDSNMRKSEPDDREVNDPPQEQTADEPNDEDYVE